MDKKVSTSMYCTMHPLGLEEKKMKKYKKGRKESWVRQKKRIKERKEERIKER